MNAIVNHKEAVPALAIPEQELIEVLRNSLYPGAQDSSIKLVIGYCKASQLDPMQKPVHIVPIWDGKAKQMRDVVMPGIGLYRTQAARSGQYAGVSEPEFGEDATETLDGVSITYPKWCRVTVRRLLANGVVVDFTAKELWKENYATQKRDSAAPNAMWSRRPYAQLAKCAEAQALRKAFPEFGSQPTADEMEGKSFEDARDITPRAASQEERQDKPALPPYPDEKLQESLPTWQARIDAGKSSADHVIAMISSKFTLSPEQINTIRALEAIEGSIAE